MTGYGKCESLIELRGPRIKKSCEKRPFHLKNALSLVVGYFITCNAPPQLVVYIKISIRFYEFKIKSL